MSSFFVTGTDTNAGKTTVSSAILLAAKNAGLRSVGYKPIESGCARGEFGPDTIALAKAAGTEPHCSYSFAAPVAPAHAAAQESRDIDLRVILSTASELAGKSELLLVEGAGGFLVPLSTDITIADLAIDLALPVIVVANNRLGAINHSLLTIEAIRQRGLKIVCFVLCDTQNSSSKDQDCNFNNAQQIRDFGKLSVHSFPFCDNETQLLSEGTRLLDELLS